MNAVGLLAHFDRLADAPDAIPRLRRFILDLAVRGKLVEQDPNDEPARKFLQDRRCIRKPETGPWELPHGWAWSSFGLIGESIGGGTPSKTDPAFWNGPIPWVSPKDMKVDFIKGAQKHVSELGIENSSTRLIPPGSLLMVVRGMILAHSFPTAIALAPVTINQDMKAVVPFRNDLIAMLLLISKGMKPEIMRLVSRSTHGTCKLLTDDLFSLPLPVPPLAEQRRIVAKVDELMALCDRLEAAQAERERRRDRLAAASLHRLNQPADADATAFRDHARFVLDHLPRLTTRPEQIPQLRQTILNLAVRGKLVPQDPSDEPAAELLKRIQAEKVRLVKEGEIKRLQPAFPIEASELPSPVPDGWEWVRISDLLLGDSQNGYSKKPDDALDGIPILRISAGTVRKDGIVAEEEHKLIGSVSVAQQEQYGLQPGDLLACRFNGNRNFVGRLSLYLGYLGIKPIYPDKLIRLRLLSRFALPKLVRWFAESSVVRRDIESFCATTVGNWGISASNLKDVKIPLPPLAEQHRIVAKVGELMALCDRLETQLTTAQTESRRLLEAVLHDALAPAS